MKVKPFLTNILILFALIFATFGAYRLGKLLPIDTQTKFTTSTYGAVTPIPLSTVKPRVAAALLKKIRSFSISPDMKNIAFATSQGVVLYDLKTYKYLQTLNETESVYLVDWSPNGEKLAAGGLMIGNSNVGKSHLAVWDTSTWKIVFEQTGNDDTLESIYGDIAWSPDSRSLADSVNSMNGIGVLVHDVQTGKVISKQETLSSHGIAWSPDGSRLVATGDFASGIRRWKVSTDESVRLFDQRAAGFMQIAWSPNGKRIVSGTFDGRVCFWTVATNQCDGLIYAHQDAVFSLAWSPDGNQIATGGGVIRIWDSNTGQLRTAFGLQDKSIYTHLEWLNPKTLVSLETGYADKALTIVRFWDIATGTVLFEFQGESSSFGE